MRNECRNRNIDDAIEMLINLLYNIEIANTNGNIKNDLSKAALPQFPYIHIAIVLIYLKCTKLIPVQREKEERPMKKCIALLISITLIIFALSSCSLLLADDKIIQSNPGGDKWSVFIYLCGTDLESKKGNLASMNIEEMLGAKKSDNVNIVFQTGGTESWGYEDINPKKIQRFEVAGNTFALKDEQPLASMGRAVTLGNFLQWGVKNYPADKYMCLLWNHGGGSISGVCFDELYENDSLNLDELAKGVSMAGVQFEMIGFDTCLMSSLETAAAIAPYARYMTASQEIEPGTGWDYNAWLSFLAATPRADGLDLGKIICDTYYDKCAAAETESIVTLSVTDLSVIPQLVASFDAMAAEMKGVAEAPDLLKSFSQAVARAENYGGNNDNEGYTNMVDLGDLVRLSIDVLPGTSVDVLANLDLAVKYKVNGESRPRSTGLSVFAPLQLREGELDVYADIAVSGHYLRYLEGTVDWTVPEDLQLVIPVTSNQRIITKAFSITDFPKVNGLKAEDFSMEFYTEVIGNDYYLTFSEGYENVASIQYNLFFMDEGSTDLYFLGSDFDVNYDDDDSTFWSNFRNVWPLINNNTCSMIPLSFSDDYILYTVPILLNEETTNLRMTYDYGTESYTIHGVWDGIDDSGMSGKEIRKLKNGDVIKFLFSYTNIETEEYVTFEFGGFTVDGDIVVEEADLFDSTYYYQFEITDIFGQKYLSDFVAISVVDGVATFIE